MITVVIITVVVIRFIIIIIIIIIIAIMLIMKWEWRYRLRRKQGGTISKQRETRNNIEVERREEYIIRNFIIWNDMK